MYGLEVGHDAFNLVELEGTAAAPYEVVYTSALSYAVVNENGVESVNLGIEFITEMPASAFDLANSPYSIDNWVRYHKVDGQG